MSNTILTVEKMNAIKACSQNNVKKLQELIAEVEFSKIQKLLTPDIYNNILDEVNSCNISDELQSILDDGLYKCIAYATYARYIQESSITDTFTGIVQKVRSDSQAVSSGTIKNIAQEYSEMAIYAYSFVKNRIEDKYGKKTSTTDINKFGEIYGIHKNINKKHIHISYL